MIKQRYISYLLLVCHTMILAQPNITAGSAQSRSMNEVEQVQANDSLFELPDELVQNVDKLTTAVDGISKAANAGVKSIPSLAQGLAREVRKTRKAFVIESNSWRKQAKKLVNVMTEQDQEIKGLNNSSQFIIKKATYSALAILFVAAALVFLYHDHTKAAQMTTPLPPVRFIDRFKKHLLSKYAGFFCLGALAYRQLCL